MEEEEEETWTVMHTRRGHTIWKNKQRESSAEVDSCSTILPKKIKMKIMTKKIK